MTFEEWWEVDSNKYHYTTLRGLALAAWLAAKAAKSEETADEYLSRCVREDSVPLANVVARKRSAEARTAHSMSEYRRVTAQGGEIAPPKHIQDAPRVRRNTFTVMHEGKQVEVVFASFAACLEREANGS